MTLKTGVMSTEKSAFNATFLHSNVDFYFKFDEYSKKNWTVLICSFINVFYLFID